MKLSILKHFLIVPVAACLAQTPAPAPKAAATAPAAKPAKPTLEDIPGSDPIVLVVGDEKMTKSEFERLVASLPDQVRARAQGPGKRQVAEQIAELKSLAQEARKRGIDKSPETKQLIAFQTENLLASTLYREIAAGIKADDAAEHAYYAQHQSDYDEVTARHILIRFKGSPVPLRAGQKELTDEEALAKAQEIRKKLEAGEDFAKLAEAESDDVQSGKQGGSLGAFTKGKMVPHFEQAAWKLQVGTISEPVRTQFGYHIIKVDKHETAKFEDVKNSIDQKLKPELAQKAAEEIKKQTVVTINDAYFGAAPAAIPAAPAAAATPPAPAH
jgi:peptidyl-prolyl cis-trans isomerase C